MKTLYEIRSVGKRDGKTMHWGSYYSREEADSSLAEKTTGDRAEWAEQYHRDWHIAEIDVTDMFEIPVADLPRDRFQCFREKIDNGAGHWEYGACRAMDNKNVLPTSTWTYRYSGRPPFEPFRQGDHYYALMSEHYTATSVMDLHTGQVIAAEPNESWGFCPVGFYVPDWWDIHDGSTKPGSRYWRPDMEKPDGSFGFVWGCVWGDDSSWKVQYLDLSRINEGVVTRDDRFGYVELDAHGTDPTEFIGVDTETQRVTFSELRRYRLGNGSKLGES